jgi:hypothetical protein
LWDPPSRSPPCRRPPGELSLPRQHLPGELPHHPGSSSPFQHSPLPPTPAAWPLSRHCRSPPAPSPPTIPVGLLVPDTSSTAPPLLPPLRATGHHVGHGGDELHLPRRPNPRRPLVMQRRRPRPPPGPNAALPHLNCARRLPVGPRGQTMKSGGRSPRRGGRATIFSSLPTERIQ